MQRHQETVKGKEIVLTIKITSGKIKSDISAVIKETVSAPWNTVISGQFPAPLSLVKEQRLADDLTVVVLVITLFP